VKWRKKLRLLYEVEERREGWSKETDSWFRRKLTREESNRPPY
jgi:hypothetical protein